MADLEKYLLELGFTNYEAKVLAAMIREGVATATLLSNTSQVPRTRIYDILHKLIHNGWVVERKGRPSKYEVINPKELLNEKIEQKKQELNRVEKDLDQIITYIEKKKEKEGEEKEYTELVLGTSNTVNIIRSLLVGAKRYVMFHQIPPSFIENLKYELKELRRKRLDVKIVARPEDKKEIRKFRRLAKVRIVKPEIREKTGMFICDDTVLHIYYSGTRFDCAKITFPTCIPCIKNQLLNEAWEVSVSI